MDDIFNLVDVIEPPNYNVFLYGPESSIDDMFDSPTERLYTEPGALIHFDLSKYNRPVLLLSTTMRTLLTKEQLQRTLETLTNYIVKHDYGMVNLFRSNLNCQKYAVVDELDNLTLGIQPTLENRLAVIVNVKSRNSRILNVDPNIFSFDPKYAINNEMLNLNNVCAISVQTTSSMPFWKDFSFWIVGILILAVIIGATFFLAFSYFTHKASNGRARLSRNDV